MTSSQQRAALQRQIWAIANDVRGAVDGWDFKQYVLGTLFYRFISENFASYIEGGDDSIHYAELPDSVITPEIKDDAIKTKGYFIYPSQLFAKVASSATTRESLNTDLAAIFAAIESSANGYPSEHDIKGLFADFDTTSNRLGNTVKDKNVRLAAVLKGVAELNFADFEGSNIDLFGDAYEFLISNYAANAGKSGGEFFTPQHVSKLIAQLAMHQQTNVNKIYDPACGSGSLLLQAKKHFDAHVIEDGFFGQEINHTTYNLARMNMLALLKNEWVPMSSRGPLRPDGRIATPTPNPAPRRGSPRRRTGSGAGTARLCLPQALERGGEVVRVKGSLRRAPPALDPASLTLPGTQFTHSKFKRGNMLLDSHIEQIMAVFDSKANVDHFAQSIPFEKVAASDYNLSVSSYVEARDDREVVDIGKLNAELKTTVARIDQLRKDIDAIVAEIEGDPA